MKDELEERRRMRMRSAVAMATRIKDLEETREMFQGAGRAHIIDREEAQKQINRINKQLWKLRERLKAIGGEA